METPEYKVLEDSFMEPNHVKPGSIVRTWGPPGPHLQPLNESAKAEMEKWYAEEFDEVDPKTGKPTGQKVRPHEKFRIRSGYAQPGDRAHIEIVSGPPKDQPGSLSLAETLAVPKAATNQRPGPAPEHMPPPGATPPSPSPAQPPPPLMQDEKGRNAAISEPPQTPPEALPAEPSTPADGTATLTAPEPTPEPIPTEVVFSAPPPSAKRTA